MPNRDKTGPAGKGPKTGRGLGLCGNGISRRGGQGRNFVLRDNNNIDEKEEKKEN